MLFRSRIMYYYTLIEARYDVVGHRQVLWSLGNYFYEIEDRTADRKFKFEGDIEDARKIFDEICGEWV